MKRPKASPRKAAKSAPVPESGPAETRRYHSRAVAKALEIIEFLKRNPEAASLTELSSHVRLTKASLLRILDTLVGGGYLEKRGDGKYFLTPDFSIVPPAGWISRLLAAAAPELKQLTRRFNESSALAQLFTNHIEVLAVWESRQMVRMGNTVGRIVQPHASSLGKVIAAYQNDERCGRLLHSYGLHPFTERTITSETELRQALKRIRRQGFAVDDEETTPGGQCFGAPIFSQWNEALAAISVSAPKIRITSKERQQEIIEAVKAAAGRISQALAAGS